MGQELKANNQQSSVLLCESQESVVGFLLARTGPGCPGRRNKPDPSRAPYPLCYIYISFCPEFTISLMIIRMNLVTKTLISVRIRSMWRSALHPWFTAGYLECSRFSKCKKWNRVQALMTLDFHHRTGILWLRCLFSYPLTAPHCQTRLWKIG